MLRRGLLDSGYADLAVSSDPAVGIDARAPVHRDPFQRLLVSRAIEGGITLLTPDARVAA